MAKEVNKKVNIWLNQQGIDNNLKSIRAAITQTANELNKLPIGSEEWLRKSEKLSKLKSIYIGIQKEIGVTSRELDALKKRTMDQIITVGSLSAAVQTASSVLRRFVSATQEYVEAYASLDDAMTNVSKYTGLTREEVKQLNEEFQRMDTRTPTEKLNALAADAGRLGITSKAAIKDFVEAADIINVALGEDLGEDAVKNIGKMAQMFGETETLGLRGAMIATASAVNSLAQSSSASEPYIMDFTARLAGVANTAGITQAHIMGIASAMDQNMAQVEKSATAVQKVMMDMMGKTEKYAGLVGMTAEEFRNLVDSDMNTAFLTVLDKLNSLSSSGGSALAETFAELKLKGTGIQETLMTLAKNTDQLREAQQLATQAYADGNSIINEYAAVNGNAAAQLDKAKKAVQDAKAALGEELLPVITDLTTASASGIRVTASIVEWALQHIGVIKTLVAEYAAYLAIKNKARLEEIKNQVVDKVSTTLRNLSIKSHVKKKVALTAEIAATEAKRLAEMKARLETLKGVAADNQLRAVLQQETIAKTANAAATRAQAQATRLLGEAQKATPWGAIAALIMSVTVVMGILAGRYRDAKKAAEKFNVECAKEQVEADRLFEKLKNAEKGTKDYEIALNDLKDKYPEIIQKHLDEEGALRDVEQAYKDVITQIQAKVAAQIKEEELTKATEDGIKKQVKALAGFNETQKATIRSMAQDGKSAEQIGSAIGISYYFTDFQGKLVKDDRYEALKKYVKAYEQMRKDVAAIDKKYDSYLQNSSAASEATADENGSGNGNGSGSGSGDSPDKKTLTARQNFLKKLRQMEAKVQAESLEGWKKTKQEIVNKYEEWLTEAEELYGKNSEEFKKVQDLKAQELSNALGKYLKTLTDASDKMMTEAKKMLDESDPDNKETPLIKAVFGEQQKWNEKMQAVRTNIANLDEIIGTMEPGDDGWDDLLSTRQTLFEQLLTLQQDNAQAISNVIRQHTQSDTDFIKDQEEKLARARMSDHDRQIAEINELYNTKIEAKRKEIAALEELLKENPENADIAKQIEELKKLIEQLETLRGKEIAAVPKSGGQRSVWQQLAEFDWSKMSENWQSALDLMEQGLQEFANAAFDILSSISQMQADRDQAELDRFVAAQDEKSKALQRQLDDGIISQKYYNAQLLKMEREKEAKEKKMKHEQFERDRAASIAKALIEGGLAVAMAFSQYGWPWGLIPAALSTAQTAAQTAMIAAQVNPYAKGSYIRGPQLALMGEEGDEWVASNKLLRDKRTASIIEALDQYQKGNRSALAGITFAAPDPKSLSQAARANGGTFAPSNQTTNNYYQNTDNPELLYEIRMLRKYMEDPNNRRAYISRRMQLDYETNENELKELARL